MGVIKVIFRKIRNKATKQWNVVAFFPDTISRGFMDSYEHIGQHSLAHIGFYHDCKLCKEDEYRELLAELTEVYRGRTLKVVKKITYK